MENSKNKPKKFPVSVNDPELRFKAKAAAAAEGKTMGEWLANAIRAALTKEGKK